MEKYAAIGKLPKAVIIVDLYGNPAKFDELLPICEKYGVTVLRTDESGDIVLLSDGKSVWRKCRQKYRYYGKNRCRFTHNKHRLFSVR